MGNNERGNEGYQPVSGYVKDGVQPIRNSSERGYQPTQQSPRNVTPPNTGSHVKPIINKK